MCVCVCVCVCVWVCVCVCEFLHVNKPFQANRVWEGDTTPRFTHAKGVTV